MLRGIYQSLYGNRGLYDYLFSYKAGSAPPIQRMDIRLGEINMVAGIPLWLIAVFLVGAIYAYKR